MSVQPVDRPESDSRRKRPYLRRRRIIPQRAALRRAIAELEVLNEIGRAISAQLHLNDLLETIYQQTSRLIDTSNFYVALYESASDQIVFPIVIENGQRVNWPPRHWSNGLTEWLLSHKRPLLISSAVEMQRHWPSIRYGRPSRSWLGVPILLGNTPIGAINVQSLDRDHAFDQRDLQLLVTIASHAAVAIANARMFEQIDQALSSRVAELEALEAVARDLNATLDLPVVLRRLIDRAVSASGADAGLVALFDATYQKLNLMVSRGYPPEIHLNNNNQWEISRGIIGRVARTGQPVFTANVNDDPDYVPARPTTRTQITVPISHGGQMLGVLALESDVEGVFNEARLRFTCQMADHAALAIHNARTLSDALRQQELLRSRSTQLTEVLRVSRALSANLQLEALLKEIVEAIRTSLGFNIAILSLFDPGPPPVLRREAGVGIPEEDWKRMAGEVTPLEWFERMMREELRISQSYFIPHNHEAFQEIWASLSAYVPDLGERAENEWHPDDALLVPLRGAAGDLIGIISVDDPVNRQIPSLETIQVLEIFANQAAVAIENARRYGESQRLAHTDPLTGLYNLRHFNLALEQEIHNAERYVTPLSLLTIDIDHFKSYNDQFGHLDGNGLLRELAHILLQTLRQSDIPARVGGEEFVVILPQTDLAGALTVAERLRSTVAKYPFPRRQVTISVGVAEFKPGMTAHDFHAAADAALYAAKAKGRNIVCW